MSPFHYFGRFVGTISGAFGGPIFMVIGFILGLIIDIVVQKTILKEQDDMGTNLIGPLFYFWGRWIVHSDSLNQDSFCLLYTSRCV